MIAIKVKKEDAITLVIICLIAMLVILILNVLGFLYWTYKGNVFISILTLFAVVIYIPYLVRLRKFSIALRDAIEDKNCFNSEDSVNEANKGK